MAAKGTLLPPFFKTKGEYMTGQTVYELALQLLACKNTDGSDSADCNDYASRAPALISILLAENLKTDRLLRNDYRVRTAPLEELGDKIACHELIAYGVLPFGLASLLVADEDPDLSHTLYERYLINIKNIKESVAAITRKIDDCYRYRG